MNRIPALLFAASLITACGDAGTDDKGPEENELTDGKDDSFYRPTEHGEMRMGIANPARITDDEQFHAWTFSLSAEANVDLSTEVSPNLDTVMYVYRRDAGADSWGRYIKKNDDDGDKISSRVRLSGDAGEYRVVVKGFKSALRGSFSLNGTCDGPGCVAADDACDAETYADLPRATPFTDACAFEISGLLRGAPVSTSGGSIGLSEKCALMGLERTAIDLYHEWWDDIVGFDDQFRYDPDEDVELNFEVVKYAAGTVITVDAGGDEDGLEMFFDADDRLLAAYQHNQSPTIDYYCGATGDAPIEGPDESCFGDIMRALPHADESARASDSVAISDAASVNEGLAVAAARHGEQFGLAGDYVVSYDLITWMSTNDDEVVAANIESEDGSVEYVVQKDYDGWKVIQEADPNGIRFICE